MIVLIVIFYLTPTTPPTHHHSIIPKRIIPNRCISSSTHFTYPLSTHTSNNASTTDTAKLKCSECALSLLYFWQLSAYYDPNILRNKNGNLLLPSSQPCHGSYNFPPSHHRQCCSGSPHLFHCLNTYNTFHACNKSLNFNSSR